MYVSLYDVFKYISYNWYMGALYHHIYRETGVFRTTNTSTLSCIISLIVYTPSQPWLIAEETLHLAELNITNEAHYIGVSYICCIYTSNFCIWVAIWWSMCLAYIQDRICKNIIIIANTNMIHVWQSDSSSLWWTNGLSNVNLVKYV